MVLPIVAAFSAAAAATTTVGIFLTYTATALTVMGALSGNKDLTKFGSLLTLGAGLVGMVSSAGAAAGGAEAVSGMDVAADAGVGAMDAGGAALSGAPATSGLDQAIAAAGDAGVSATEVIDPMQRANEAMGVTAEAAPSNVFERASNSASASVGEQADSIMGKTFERHALQTGSTGGSSGGMPSGVTINGEVMNTDPLAQFAGSNTSSQINNLGQRGAGAPSTNPLSQIGNWVKNNKELAQLGGQLVGGLANGYGQAQQLGYEQSIMERRLRNLNSPIALKFGTS